MRGSWLGLVLIVGGCGTDWGDFGYTCDDHTPGHRDLQGNPDPCKRHDDGCDGECVPFGPNSEAPVLVWSGPADETPPECPERAPRPGKEGFADLEWSHQCPACECENPTGSCELPTGFTAHAAQCPATGAETTSFDAPFGWDGSCDAASMIPQGLPCMNGPCVQSLSIDPLVMKETGCMRKTDPVPNGAPIPTVPTWKTFMKVCEGAEYPLCNDGSLYCAPTSEPPPPGFSQCIKMDVDEECPADTYPDRHVIYPRWGYNDSRWCTDCKCGPPMGSYCMSQISVWANSTCSGFPVWSEPVTTGYCKPIYLPGTALGSKQAEPPVYMPGMCEPLGGEKIGGVEPIQPITAFCCRSETR